MRNSSTQVMPTRAAKTIAVIQSNYIPWKGYFDMINFVDEFVLYDDVQYTKNDWRNRNKIKTYNGLQWLTIPVRHTLAQKINETKVISHHWRKKHWTTISHSYSKTAFFNVYAERLKALYLDSQEEWLSRINSDFIAVLNDILGIQTRITWSHDYDLKGCRVERLVDLLQKVHATEYLSGPAAKEYIDPQAFEQANIRLTWMDYTGYPEYHQLFPPFNHYVSILDLIFNEGPKASKYMLSFHEKHTNDS